MTKKENKKRKSTDWHEFMTKPRSQKTDWAEFMRRPRLGRAPSMTPNEQQIFSLIRDHGGEMSIFAIARELNYTADYTRLICESLGRRDIIDVFASGKCKIPKGR
jgi:uncharacterized membrane protein